MPSGRQVYARLSEEIEQLDGEATRLAQEVEGLEGEIGTIESRRTGAYRALAELHLPDLTAESVGTTLKDLVERLLDILQEKKRERSDCSALLKEAVREEAHLRDRLTEATARLDLLEDETERLEALVEGDLGERDGYRILEARALQAQHRVVQGTARLEAAEAEREERVPAYHADPLFSYLKARGFGSASAKGNFLSRHLDRWVADVVGFESADESYQFLNQIPAQVAEVLDRDRQALRDLGQQMASMEREAADRLGLSEALQRREASIRERGSVVEQLESIRRDRDHFRARLDALANTRGEFYEKAMGDLQAYLRAEPLAGLEVQARETRDPRDDEIVAELARLQSAATDLSAKAEPLREESESTSAKLRALRVLQAEFVKNGYDSSRSTFGHDFDMGSLLSGYLAGHHDLGHVRQRLRKNHYYRSNYRTSSGSRMFRGGGFSSGGFRSGGGFNSGGGFSTGGGF
jgi:DNA repair exonuclease SbcCD ATPase subunit